MNNIKHFCKLFQRIKIEQNKKIKENPDFIAEIFQHSIKSSSDILYNNFDKDNELKNIRKYTKSFNNRLYKTRENPVDNFESLIELISSYTVINFIQNCLVIKIMIELRTYFHIKNLYLF